MGEKTTERLPGAGLLSRRCGCEPDECLLSQWVALVFQLSEWGLFRTLEVRSKLGTWGLARKNL